MLLFCIFSLLIISSVFCDDKDVVVLTDANFADKTNVDIMLVEFYAPWCGHCKALAPEYERAATILLANDPPIPLAKVDCTGEGKDSCSKYGVSGYPTLKIFKNGAVSKDYDGPRQTDGIVKYMRSRAGPSSRLLDTDALFEKFTSKKEYVVVGFFEKEGSSLHKDFTKAADVLNEKFSFGHTFSESISKKAGHSNSIVVFQPSTLKSKFEPSVFKYESGDLQQFIKNSIRGLCGHRQSGNREDFGTPLVVAYYDVDYVKNVKGTNYWRNRVMKVGKKFVDAGESVTFAVSSSSELASELEEFGLTASGDKPVVAARDSSNQKFVMSADFSMDALETFVRDMLDGKLEPYMKSEPIPDEQTDAVKTVVAKNFEEIVNDKSKDVLIEFYAPWCGHCKSLAPKYEELAEKLKDESGITIAKMDATANDVPKQYEVRGFPTLYFAPKNNKASPVAYQGGREVDDFVKYLAKEATDELEGFKRNGKPKKTKKKQEL